MHAIERVFDAFRARPLGMIVFAASAALLLYLQVVSQGSIRAEAVAHGPHAPQPARVASFVTEVYVRAGEQVHEGTPLVALSAHFVDRELAQLDAEVERLMHEARLAQASLVVKEQSWLDPQVRLRPDRPSLEDPTKALYAKELAVLHIRRRQLFDDRSSLTVKASSAGRVVYVLPQGAAVAAGGAVATLAAELAEEIVAYVPASTRPDSIEVGAVVRISRPAGVCAGPGKILRRGAAVAQAPEQLEGFLGRPVHGMPVYISVPEGCSLGVGQTLTVEFARSVM